MVVQANAILWLVCVVFDRVSEGKTIDDTTTKNNRENNCIRTKFFQFKFAKEK